MIVPIITYSNTLRIPCTKTQNNKLRSLHNRALSIIRTNSVPSIVGLINRDICLLVRKCLTNELKSPTFNNYFKKQHHERKTRNNNHMVKLPRVKLEVARQSFYFAGGNLYNSLPLAIRKTEELTKFRKALSGYFT